MDNKENFNFSYSAKEQDEIKAIREKYLPSEESNIERLRRLDSSASKKARVRAIILGVLGALILGVGMSLIMTNFGAFLGLAGNSSVVVGVIIGVAGMAIVACTYPVYNLTVKKEREKVAPDIIRLTDELMK